MPVEGVAILLAGHDVDGILSATYRRIGSGSSEPFPVDETVTGKVLREGSPFHNDKVVCFPLMAAGKKVGLLYAVMEAKGIECFTGGHIRLLQAVAATAAVVLEHARYVAWLEGENRRLKEAINAEHEMIGRSEKMQQVYEVVSRAARSD